MDRNISYIQTNVHYFPLLFLCADAGLAFLLLLKCPWVFLLVPGCWNRILSIARLQKCLFSVHCWRPFPCTEQFLSCLLFFLSPSFPSSPAPFFILYNVLLTSGVFSDNLWHILSLIFSKSIKIPFLFLFMLCVTCFN